MKINLRLDVVDVGKVEFREVPSWCCKDGLVSIALDEDRFVHYPVHRIRQIDSQAISGSGASHPARIRSPKTAGAGPE